MAQRFMDSRWPTGFTLIELLLVLVILGTMMAVTLPYAARSHEGLRLEQEVRNMAEAVRYAMQLAERANRPVRILLDAARGCYSLQMATSSTEDYVTIEDPIGVLRHLDSRVRIVRSEGFEPGGKDSFCLYLDPQKPWPEASLELSAGDLIGAVHITGRLVKVEDVAKR